MRTTDEPTPNLQPDVQPDLQWAASRLGAGHRLPALATADLMYQKRRWLRRLSTMKVAALTARTGSSA